MRIVLLLATQRGLRCLRAIHELARDHELVVLSFPEEPCEPRFLAEIEAETRSMGDQFFTARNVAGAALADFWTKTPIDLLLAVSWRYLVPPSIYRRATRGAFVFHDSLLPEHRGFSPTVWAIANGEDHTGVTLFEMVEAVDAGDIVDQQRVPIGADDTIATVVERVTNSYVTLLQKNLSKLLAGNTPRTPQDHGRATYTCRRTAEDNRIDWNWPTERVYNLVRAVTAPYSGAFTSHDGRRVVAWSARPLRDAPRYVGRAPGRVVDVQAGRGVVVLTGDGSLLIENVQIDGQPIVTADAVIGRIGDQFG